MRQLERINPINARTQSIELAVEELSKRDSITMTDVRVFMDNLVSQKISTGKKSTFVDPNGEEQEYEIKAPISKFYSYRSDENEILIRSQIGSSKHKVQPKPELEGNVKVSTALKELKKVAWNIRADSVYDFTKLILGFIEYTRTGKMEQNNIYLKSAVEGNGKSFLMHKFFDSVKEVGVSAGVGAWPRGEHSDLKPFMENMFTIIEDTSPDTKRNLNVDQLKAILRREDTDMNLKYAPVQKAKMNAFVWANGNCNFPYNTRGFTTIETNSITIEELSKQSKQVLEDALEADLLVLQRVTRVSNILINISRNFHKKDIQINNSLAKFKLEMEKLPDVETLVRFVQTYKDSAIDFSKCCLNDFLSLEDLSRDEREKKAFFFTKTLKYLFTKGVVKVLTRGQELYSKWNLSALRDINIEDFEIKCDELDPMKEIEETFAEWDRLIKFVEDFENGNDPNGGKEDMQFLNIDKESKLDDSWTICNKYDTEGSYNKEGDQVCVNKPLEDETPNRKNERVKKENYLFECDEISKEEQIKLIEKLPQEVKDSVLWVCSSGGKSLHTVIHTNTPDDASSELRKFIHTKLNECYFNNNADPSGANAARLARAPNAIRQDEKYGGKRQICLHFNMNARALDVSKWVREYNDSKEEERIYRNFSKLFEPERKEYFKGIHTLQELKDWNNKNPSKAKVECIEFLEGTLKDWNRGIACVRELRNFGFDDSEIELEGQYNDKWIKSAIKAAK